MISDTAVKAKEEMEAEISQAMRARISDFKKHAEHVTDFNDITYHFIECIHVHLENTKPKALGGGPAIQQTMGTQARYQTPVSNQFLVNSGASGSHGSDISKSVLDVFQDPAGLALEHGLHVDDVARRLGMPRAKIMEAIGYHVDVSNIYSTIDDDHYKSACNG